MSAVRCGQCGAKNTNEKAFRCRLCGMLLPDHHRKRMLLAGATDGPTFSDIVESEVGTWRRETGAYAKKPKRVYEPPESNANVGMALMVALVVAFAVIIGAAQVLIA